ncbi:MAG: MlaE family lipid ABC transporter permease subunit [Caldithrix sp.]|nr:MlaE family lipid ABC transporter permease subunit [Caldithrix sp.]
MQIETIYLPASLTVMHSRELLSKAESIIKLREKPAQINLDFSDVTVMDSAGALSVHHIQHQCAAKNIDCRLHNLSTEIEHSLKLFKIGDADSFEAPHKLGFFERLGHLSYEVYISIKDAIILMANISYFTFTAFFKPKLRRRGEVINQGVQIGVNALPIIALIAFLIGFILALQSAAQLRQFGANIYVADLVAIAMFSEMGPLITAIMVAGRTSSAIAAEVATMTVSEEIDALKVMGIDAIPYVIIPKLYAITISLPILATFANVVGIIGGMVIGVTYLDLEVLPFFNEVISVIRYKEIFIYLLKSVVFAFLITFTGAFHGFRVKGGAEGVGRSTTSAVVLAIFLVIVADSIIGLLFYFEG